jgi:hypothetical protein
MWLWVAGSRPDLLFEPSRSREIMGRANEAITVWTIKGRTLTRAEARVVGMKESWRLSAGSLENLFYSIYTPFTLFPFSLLFSSISSSFYCFMPFLHQLISPGVPRFKPGVASQYLVSRLSI